MQKSNGNLHKMNFFSGQTFVLGDSNPQHGDMHRGKAIFYGIQYNHSGRFTLQIDHGTIYSAEGPHAFFTTPGHYYEYGSPPGETRSHNFICSEGPRCQYYIDSGLMDTTRDPPLIPVKKPEKFLTTMTEILTLMRQPEMIPPRAVLLFEDLLLQLYEFDAGTPHLPIWQEHFFTNLLIKIRNAPTKEWDFQAQAKLCCITEIHFRRLFKLLAGLPPQQFLIQQRLQFAVRLLLEKPLMPISAVAEMSRIGNVYYFSRLFKKRYHVSPREFRRSLAGYRH